MNSKQMKSPVAATNRVSRTFTRLHWFMTAIGIVTAIACTLVLMREIQPNAERLKQSHFTSSSSVARNIISVKALSTFSVLTKF